MENYPLMLNLIFKTQKENDDEDIFDYTDTNGYETTVKKNEKNIFYCKEIKKSKICYFPEQKKIDEKFEILFRARKSKFNHYELIYPIIKLNFRDTNNIAKLDNRMWYLTNSENKNNKYKYNNEIYNILENDIIKFGCVKYELIEKHINSSFSEIKNQLNGANHQFGSIFSYENDENKQCSICNELNSSEENPKVKLCKCDEYMHYKCIKKRLKDKNAIPIEEKDKGNVISYKYGEFNCKKCECQYPYKFKINNKDFTLLDLKIPEKDDYIILESLSPIKEDNKNIKKIFVVKITNKEIKIGRNHLTNDIIINEHKKISREHCILKYDKENECLKLINKSLYGTSVLIKGNLKIELNKKFSFQIGRLTYIEAKLEKE